MPGKPSQGDFLTALWGEQTGVAELACGRPRPDDRTKTGHFWGEPFPYPEGLDDCLALASKKSGKVNLYYGVCLRRETWPRIGIDGKEEKRGTIENVLSATALWVDIDFKTIPRERALELLKRFPLKPSIGVFSGGGFNILWLLKEPATGDELKRVSPINVAISRQVGGDHTHDLARVLRLPGTPNIKYDPAPTAEIVVWRPQLRYNLFDFDFLPEESPQAASAAPVAVPQETPEVDVGSLPVSDVTMKVIREGLPAFIEYRSKGPEGAAQKKLSRSEADAWVVTQLLNAGVTVPVIFGIFRNPANKISEKYLERKRDGDGYLSCTIQKMKEWIAKHPNASGSSRIAERLENMFSDRGPYEVKKILRFPQEPPTYEVVIAFAGQDWKVKADLKGLYQFAEFKKLFFSAHHRFLPSTKQFRWQEMVEDAEMTEQPIEKEEGTFDGRLTSCMGELFESAVGEKSGDVAIQHLPVRTEDGKELVKTTVLLRYLKAQGMEAERSQVVHALKQMGWQSGTHRFGQKVVRVWVRAGTNGEAKPTPQGELFPLPGAPGTGEVKSGQ